MDPILEQGLEKAWRFVGRFVWAFAIVESQIDELLVYLFKLNAGASLLLLNKLNLRTKLNLVGVVLRQQNVDNGKTLVDRVHKIANIRNAVAHYPFGPEGDAISFDYVNQSGDLILPGRRKVEGSDEELPWDTEISYSEFDSYDAEMRKLWEELAKIPSCCKPIGEIDNELAAAIEEFVDSSDNVIPFPRRSPSTDISEE